MNSKASDLVKTGVENGEAQTRGKLLAATHRGLIKEVERKRPDRSVVLETGAQPADAEIAQGAGGQHQSTGSVEANVAAVEQDGVTGAHCDGDAYITAILGCYDCSKSAGKSEIVAGNGKAVGRSDGSHGKGCHSYQGQN